MKKWDTESKIAGTAIVTGIIILLIICIVKFFTETIYF